MVTTAAVEGAFYGQTSQETRYWINPAPGRNFVFDLNFFRSIPFQSRNGNPRGEAMPTGLDDRPYARYLNPLR